MEIARERFLDESRAHHLTLSLRSRTTEMHSVMTALSKAEHEAVAAALARALDDIHLVVAARLVSERERQAQPTTITS